MWPYAHVPGSVPKLVLELLQSLIQLVLRHNVPAVVAHLPARTNTPQQTPPNTVLGTNEDSARGRTCIIVFLTRHNLYVSSSSSIFLSAT